MRRLNWCPAHWDALCTAINDYKKSGHSEHLTTHREQVTTWQTADKSWFESNYQGFAELVWAWNKINERALDKGARLNECPLCFIHYHHDNCQQAACIKLLPSEWIDACILEIISISYQSASNRIQ